MKGDRMDTRLEAAEKLIEAIERAVFHACPIFTWTPPVNFEPVRYEYHGWDAIPWAVDKDGNKLVIRLNELE